MRVEVEIDIGSIKFYFAALKKCDKTSIRGGTIRYVTVSYSYLARIK
jgi:hypothetical protein